MKVLKSEISSLKQNTKKINDSLGIAIDEIQRLERQIRLKDENTNFNTAFRMKFLENRILDRDRKDYYIALTGAKKNSGDFLITDSAIKLLEEIRPDRIIIKYPAWKLVGENLDIFNNSKAVLILGGPGYRIDSYPKVYPLANNLNKLQIPIIPIGLGTIYRNSDLPNIKSTPKNLLFVQKLRENIENGCRGPNSKLLLETLGISNVNLIGCPAFHCGNSPKDAAFFKPETINNIAFSLPAKLERFIEVEKILDQLLSKVPDSKLTLFLHRGGEIKDEYSMPDDFKISELAKSLCSKYKTKLENISYSSRGFDKYLKADLHLGYRVHAHIFCISHLRPSYLINEDGRGEEIQKALELPSIDSGDLENQNVVNSILQDQAKDWSIFDQVPLTLEKYKVRIEEFILNLP